MPYVVGSMTNYKLEKMNPFGDYMLSIDPDATQVRQMHGDRITSVDTHVIYCEQWQKVLRNSSQPNDKKKSSLNVTKKQKRGQK